MSDKWKEYERQKKLIQAMNYEDYENQIRALAKRLGL